MEEKVFPADEKVGKFFATKSCWFINTRYNYFIYLRARVSAADRSRRVKLSGVTIKRVAGVPTNACVIKR